MQPYTKEMLTMLCTFTGVFLLYSTIGVYHYWGNLSVYSNSYLRNDIGPDPSIKTPWVISLNIIGLAIGSFMAGYVTSNIGPRGAVILGCLLLDCGVFLTYFSVKVSVLATNLSMGFLNGLGIGVLFSTGYVIVTSCRPKRLGLVIAVVESAVCAGAAVLSQITTFYINPSNLTPDVFDGKENYFTQKEVLDKVPSVFLLIGCVYICLHAAALFLLTTAHEKQRTASQGGIQTYKDCEKHVETGDILSTPLTSSNGTSNGSQNGIKTEICTETSSRSAPAENLSPKQMLKCRSFYVVWLCLCFCSYSYTVMNNFFKTYGQTWIPDDRFLANLATAQLLLMTLTRLGCGMLLDRCGVKLTLALQSCTMSVASAFWYFTPIVGRWMYFLWTLFYASSISGVYIVFPLTVVKLFGAVHFPQNYGFVLSSSVLLNFTAPSIIQFTVSRFGWFYLFFSTACGTAVAVILGLVALPHA